MWDKGDFPDFAFLIFMGGITGGGGGGEYLTLTSRQGGIIPPVFVDFFYFIKILNCFTYLLFSRIYLIYVFIVYFFIFHFVTFSSIFNLLG